ncbi:hypothetical protein [Heyndrickxia acidicola]|uniref:Uncharacterized protein n=1 Tax=Heyndrickxia acidicola TaxID=209389 RepID=A0ABU6MNC5_9BACI|nr:hypothetical protein [Heyndrickxia acidicola]MED1205878.1 hypothetical protein [Heyndrickxia acidicola]
MNVNLNLKPFQGQMDHMVLQLAILLIVPLIAGLFLKWCLRVVIKLPNALANFVATLGFLVFFYNMIKIVLG